MFSLCLWLALRLYRTQTGQYCNLIRCFVLVCFPWSPVGCFPSCGNVVGQDSTALCYAALRLCCAVLVKSKKSLGCRWWKDPKLKEMARTLLHSVTVKNCSCSYRFWSARCYLQYSRVQYRIERLDRTNDTKT
jgi:hypothetical protein